MFKNLFGKKSVAKAEYDIVEIAKDCYTVHLTNEQSQVLAEKGLKDVRELTLTKCENTWKVEYSFQDSSGSWQNVSSGGIAFADESLESVLDGFFN